ncbi:hypothetical protein ACQ4PT_052711 [Festuca glaucescens]
MASQLALPAASPPPAPTTIFTIGDDLLLEIFVRLPSLPTLVRAAFACRTFLHAVRSSPTFRPRFRALHPPPLIGLFVMHRVGDIPSFVPLRGRADPDHAALIRGSDFFLTRLPDDQGFWDIDDCRDGYLLLHNSRTGCWPPTACSMGCCIGSVLPWTEAATINKDHPEDDKNCLPPTSGRLVNGRIYWTRYDYLIVLDTTTLHFSSMDLPPFMDGQKPFVLGETQDEKLCMVCAIDGKLMIAVWVWRADDDDRVEKWMLDKEIELGEIPVLKLVGVNHGFLHLHLIAIQNPNTVPLCSFFSFYLETAELKKIFSLDEYELERSYPYIMPWPSSLVCNKVKPRIEGA